MAKEIERKYLVKGDAWRKLAAGTPYTQGYISANERHTVRVRTISGKGFLTVKGPTTGAVRNEFEYEIPIEDARIILADLCPKPLIEKRRHKIPFHGLIWEVDEFEGANAGLIIAEVELTTEDQLFPIPGWIDREITGDPRYYNAALAAHPYTEW